MSTQLTMNCINNEVMLFLQQYVLRTRETTFFFFVFVDITYRDCYIIKVVLMINLDESNDQITISHVNNYEKYCP